MPRATSLTPWQGQSCGCPTCGALPRYPCVVVTASKLAKLARLRQYTPGGPLPECHAIHPARTLRATMLMQQGKLAA
jgi:hypothetical protein